MDHGHYFRCDVCDSLYFGHVGRAPCRDCPHGKLYQTDLVHEREADDARRFAQQERGGE